MELQYRQVRWREEWSDLSNHLTLVAIRADLQKIHAQDVPPDVGDVNQAITSAVLTTSGVTNLMFYKDELVLTRTSTFGSRSDLYYASENSVIHTSFRKGGSVRKVWTRYFTFDAGTQWKCTYNENPTSPKHMRGNSIPYTGIQLGEELLSLNQAREKHSDQDVRDVANAYADTLRLFEWKDDFSKEDMDTLSNKFALIQATASAPHIHREHIAQALDVLQSVALLRPDASATTMSAIFEQRLVQEQQHSAHSKAPQ